MQIEIQTVINTKQSKMLISTDFRDNYEWTGVFSKFM